MNRPADPSDEAEALAEEFFDDPKTGKNPDRAALLKAHPDIADALDRRLTLMEMLHGARPAGAGPNSTSSDENLIRIQTPTGSSVTIDIDSDEDDDLPE